MDRKTYIGLDVGTDSVGYAVTDGDYNLIKHRGEPMWGASVFEAGNTKAERRAFRTARRRLDRRQMRVKLAQDIFARQIFEVDPKFFIRIQESGLYREDTSIDSTFFLFEEDTFSDRQYHDKYPTIHHLIVDLMKDDAPKDVRLVYLTVAWFMAHRGHFLNEIDKTNIEGIMNFDLVYKQFCDFCNNNYGGLLWECDEEEFRNVLLTKVSVSRKERLFLQLLNDGKKYKDLEDDVVSRGSVIKLLSGGKIKPDKIYLNSEYSEIESVSLGMPEENFANVLDELSDDGELLLVLRKLFDWALLAGIVKDGSSISEAKVAVYERHKADLEYLKGFVRKYIPQKYNQIFKDYTLTNYAAYSGHSTNKRCDKETFLAFLSKLVKDIDVAEEDKQNYQSMLERIDLRDFLPKQVDGDNRVIPYQLYWHELNCVLKNARRYLPFLDEKDSEGYSNIEKLMAVFEFRIPYYVGPLRTDNSNNSWMVRKEGTTGDIFPWNFDKLVDLDKSEQRFIDRMTNHCTYLPEETVLPKCSLLYQRFMVLNEINNICVNGVEIPVEVKQQVFDKFRERKKVSVKMIEGVLLSNGCMQSGDSISGIDVTIKNSLSSYHSFKRLIENGILSEHEVEKIIKYITYSEDKIRFRRWLDKEYPNLSEDDKKYIARLRFTDFGRLSEKLLTGIEGIDKSTGEAFSMIDAMWITNNNMMQLIFSDRFTFKEELEVAKRDFYAQRQESVDDICDRLYVSNSVRRPIYRTLAILDDIRKATKKDPDRIFIEMARGGGKKGKRTSSRREQIENLYANYSTDEVRALSKELEGTSDNELQSEVLFLYFMQLGICMYSGQHLDIDLLKTSAYNVDHIYPQSKVKDDSISNKVLVLSQYNSEKGDKYPIPAQWREKMRATWHSYKDRGLISEDKYRRLMRNTSFDEEELQGFINRQLVETRQSTKALAEIIKKKYPETEIIYVKAGLVSDFRKKFDMLKSRQVNDLHHGKDAYLNIVCGNVYHCRFTKNFSVKRDYSLKTETLFTHHVNEDNVQVWSGQESIAKVAKTMAKNNLHYTRFTFERKGGLFDQMPVKAGSGALPRKANLPIEKYGGYNRSTASFFVLVKYAEKNKTDIMIMPVDLCMADKVMKSEDSLCEYAKNNIAKIIGKTAESIEILGLPLGLRKIKINTVLSLDGFKVAITGKTGERIMITPIVPLLLSMKEETFVKKLERFIEKKKIGKISVIDSDYDGITEEECVGLFDRLISKASVPALALFYGSYVKTLSENRTRFIELSLENKTELLLNAISIFKTGRSGGCDLSLIGGVKNEATLRISFKLNNWKKNNLSAKIGDISPSGIYESWSDNLLEML